jgi:hypothetical protein
MTGDLVMARLGRPGLTDDQKAELFSAGTNLRLELVLPCIFHSQNEKRYLGA